MLAIIGNSPSSGSSFLADLLDSTPQSVCGEELNLFSNRAFYDFKNFKKNIRKSSLTCGIHGFRNRINFHRLHLYGMNEKDLQDLIEHSTNLKDFTNKFILRFMTLRGKNTAGILFEKTPENVNCIHEFLTHFPESYFIHIVRNPLYVFPSLLKRNFPPYIAITSWLIDVAKFIKYKNHPHIIQIKYEELVKDPFRITRQILKSTANILNISEEQIKTDYENNKYRELFAPRITSWSINTYGKVKNANINKLSEDILSILSSLLNYKITSAYAKHFDIAQISFLDALNEFDYTDEVLESLKNSHKSKAKIKKDNLDYLRLFYKWTKDFQYGDASIFKLPSYLNPIEKIQSI